MKTTQIAKWLNKNKPRFPLISIECEVSVPTLYSIADTPDKKRQQRIIDALTKYIEEQKEVKDGKQ